VLSCGILCPVHAEGLHVNPATQFFPMAAATGPATQESSTFVAFLKLGVEHIWTGYDHLLFLFGLLVVCARFRAIVAIISCFTLGHSLTLALATLDIVNLPARYTEPLIAASIVFVGVENLVRRGAEPRGRWALTFFFGLIHGFGFASVLRELGVGQSGSGLAMPLFSFNLGVELGQIAIAALILPIIWRMRKNEKFLRLGVPALSAIVALAGLYWFLERTIFA
jgi:hydrogenase/urease accessory protein HupE